MIFENDNSKGKTERRSRVTAVTPYSGLGKLPPQATDLEEIVIGALMLETVSQSIWNMIRAEMFYKDSHQKIFNAANILKTENTPIDLATVTSKLRKLGELEMIGGMYALTLLTERGASSANIEYYIAIIHEKFLARELIRISTEMITNCYDDTSNPLEEMGKIITIINDLKKGIFKRTEKDSNQLADEALAEMLKPKKEGLIGLTTGLKGLDFVTKGDQEGSLRVVAADTSVGKTIELCSEVVNSCFDENKKLLAEQIPTAVFSLEMPSSQLTFRFISDLSSVGNTQIKTNAMTQQEKERVSLYLNLFREAQVYIDDTPGLTINEFEAKAALLVALHSVKKIYIDYFQLMKGDPNKKYGTRENELADISKRLKACAKELHITIVVYSQLGPEIHKRALSMPMLNDLRECKALGFDADIVMFIWRPEYYEEIIKNLHEKQIKIYCNLFDITVDSFSKMCFIIVAKNRDGELGKVPFKFEGKIMRISDNQEVLDAIERMKRESVERTSQTELTTEQVEVTF